MGYPYFNPPTTQKVNKIEEGNFFVPTLGVMPSSVEDYVPKSIKVIKTCIYAVAAVTFVILGILVISEQIGIPLG